MPVHAIQLNELERGLPRNDDQARRWCAALEAGGVLYFPQTPLPIADADVQFLLGKQQTASRVHKNIAYKPDRDLLSGIDRKTTGRRSSIISRTSCAATRRSVDEFLAGFLAPYQKHWRLDYASFRPLEEAGARHVRAASQRSAAHRRISHPPHARLADSALLSQHSPIAHPRLGGRRALRTRRQAPSRPLSSPFRSLTAPSPGRQKARPAQPASASFSRRSKRTPYDEFMMQLHNAMKEDADFQQSCVRENFNFPPGSSWMVYTETVPHAVLAGQFALEQTFLVDPAAMVTPQSAPIAILEKMAGAALA